jgi:hypothetical protein
MWWPQELAEVVAEAVAEAGVTVVLLNSQPETWLPETAA